jgi:hypothetical protein
MLTFTNRRRGFKSFKKQMLHCGVIFSALVISGVAGTYLDYHVNYIKGEPSPSYGTGTVYYVYAQSSPVEEVVVEELIEEEVKGYDIPIDELRALLNKHLGGHLTGMGDSFIRHGNTYRMDPVLLAVISIHETGNGKSAAIKNRNNAAGIMMKDGMTLQTFNSIDESIERMARLLREDYIDGRGHTSIRDIGLVYCPVGVANDPKNLNQHWIPRVEQLYRDIVGVNYYHEQ